MSFGVEKVGTLRIATLGKALDVPAGKYGYDYYSRRPTRGNKSLIIEGGFHVIPGLQNFRAKMVIPPPFENPDFIKNCNQALNQGRMLDGPEKQKALEAANRFKNAGRSEMEKFIKQNPGLVFLSDAVDYPSNECRFMIKNGKLLPLPPGSYPLFGKHWMATTNGQLDFKLVDLSDPASVQAAGEGFFVHKIVDNCEEIEPAEEVPGTGLPSVTYCRDDIEHLVNEAKYSDEMNSLKRSEVNAKLVEHLRRNENLGILQGIVNGRPLNFGSYGWISFELNPYPRTYWMTNRSGEEFCIKTYPDPGGKSPAGVAFDVIPYFLFEVAKVFDLGIVRDAYIGTGGKNVRVIVMRDGAPEPILTINGKYLSHLQIPIPTYVAFLGK